jgi:phosphoribosylformylglycinamidine synthase
MAFTGGLGIELDVSLVPVSEEMRDDFILFSESNGRLLVEVRKEDVVAFEEAMGGSTFAKVGSVVSEDMFVLRNGSTILIELPLAELIEAWKTPLEVPR